MKLILTVLLLLISVIAICRESKYEILARACVSEFSEELFVKCVYILCEQPEYVLSQSYHETGWFTSYNCIHRNNLFGMTMTKNSLASRSEGQFNYSVYDHWFLSLLDYVEWQKEFYHGGNYMSFLINRGYSTDGYYGRKILAMKYCKEFQDRIKKYKL